jgi:ATP-dependent Clp protease ATP-binding subunit ClpA
MSKDTKDNFIVYSHVLDVFISIRKLTDEEIEDLVVRVVDTVTAPKSSISQFIELILEKVVIGYPDLISDADDGVREAIFECVTEIYPGFSLELISKTVNSYMHGEGELPDGGSSSLLSLKQVDKISKALKSNVIGQNEAVDEIIKHIKLIESKLEKSSNLFFIGPTGVGKTEMAKVLASAYLGNESRLLKINCGEYSSSHEYAKLVGSPPGYIGHGEKGLLTQKASESSKWVILFDEIEKAHSKLYDLLLNLMDEGTITDNQGVVLDFSNSIILYTSNVGLREFVGKTYLGFGEQKVSYEEAKSNIESVFKEKFSPEFINRLDAVIYFNTLNKDDAKKIAKLHLKKLPLKVSPKLVSYVVDEAFSEDYGARNIRRFIKNNISIKIADKILSGKVSDAYTPLFKKNEFLGFKSV